jgi:hypothetical protein
MAKYMLILRGSDETIAAMQTTPVEQLLEMMGRFNEELMRAGVMLAGEGLDPTVSVVVDHSSEPPLVTDGPYGETKELFGGYYILDVATLEEAVEWARRRPSFPGAKTEVRRIADVGDLPQDIPQDNEWIGKGKAWREQLGQQ